MGQFKPMVKMETTEPSVELKLKKGGAVKRMTKMAPDAVGTGHKKMAGGGLMAMLSKRMPPEAAPAPGKPSMAMRRKAMMPKMSKAPAMPSKMSSKMGMPSAIMKKGGHAEFKEMGADMAQDKTMIKKAMKQHDAQEHPGGKGTKLKLKSGGVSKGNGGGYKTGGVVKGQGGYATGGVAESNAGGYKKGGASKKHFATGGTVDSGRAVAMPQGKKPPSKPAIQTNFSGVFKNGGSAKKKVAESLSRGMPKRYAAGGMAEGGMPDMGANFHVFDDLKQAAGKPAMQAGFGNQNDYTAAAGKPAPDFYAMQAGFGNAAEKNQAMSMGLPQAAQFYPQQIAMGAGYKNAADMNAAKGVPSTDYYAMQAGMMKPQGMSPLEPIWPQGMSPLEPIPPTPPPVVPPYRPPVVPPKPAPITGPKPGAVNPLNPKFNPVPPPKPPVVKPPVVKPPVTPPKPPVMPPKPPVMPPKPPVMPPKPKVVTVPMPKPAPIPKVERPGPMPEAPKPKTTYTTVKIPQAKK